jgi:hypothetical protein
MFTQLPNVALFTSGFDFFRVLIFFDLGVALRLCQFESGQVYIEIDSLDSLNVLRDVIDMAETKLKDEIAKQENK